MPEYMNLDDPQLMSNEGFRVFRTSKHYGILESTGIKMLALNHIYLPPNGPPYDDPLLEYLPPKSDV